MTVDAAKAAQTTAVARLPEALFAPPLHHNLYKGPPVSLVDEKRRHLLSPLPGQAHMHTAGGSKSNTRPKLKSLRPTLREKKRYLAYEVIAPSPLSGPESVLARIQATLGSFGAAKAGVVPISFNAKTQRGLVRVSAKGLASVQASFLFQDFVIVRSVGVSGILHKAQRLLENS
jgi:ribonuclease P/MRP protein subunit POP5